MKNGTYESIKILKKNGYNFNVVYDIGANVGKWTADCKRHLPEAQYILFEPNTRNIVRHSKNDKVFYQLLSDIDDKEYKFYIGDPGTPSTGNGYYKEQTAGYTTDNHVVLTSKTLDSMVKKHKLPKPNFIKLDTQGSEVDILNGAKESLDDCFLAVCELQVMPYNKGAAVFSDYINAFYDLGFVPCGVEHIAIRKNILNQFDIVFIKSDINNDLFKHRQRYTGFN